MRPAERIGEEGQEERLVPGYPKCVPTNISPRNAHWCHQMSLGSTRLHNDFENATNPGLLRARKSRCAFWVSKRQTEHTAFPKLLQASQLNVSKPPGPYTLLPQPEVTSTAMVWHTIDCSDRSQCWSIASFNLGPQVTAVSRAFHGPTGWPTEFIIQTGNKLRLPLVFGGCQLLHNLACPK